MGKKLIILSTKNLGTESLGEPSMKTATSHQRGWNHVYFARVKGLLRDPVSLVSFSNTVSIPWGGTCEAEWGRGRRILRRQIGPGNISIFPAFEEHTFRSDRETEAFSWQISTEMMRKHASEKWFRGVGPAILGRFSEPDKILHQAALRLAAILAEPPEPGQQLHVEEIQATIIQQLLKAHSSISAIFHPEKERLSSGRLARSIEMLHEMPEKELGLETLAAMANLSIFHFLREFRRLTGQTPHRMLVRLRMEKACSLVVGTRLPLSQIAQQCGYSSPSHMAHTFGRLTGCSPTELRSWFNP